MSKHSTFSLKATLVQRAIDAKLSTGKFVDSGAKYSPEQATADASNSDLRLSARVASNGALSWGK